MRAVSFEGRTILNVLFLETFSGKQKNLFSTVSVETSLLFFGSKTVKGYNSQRVQLHPREPFLRTAARQEMAIAPAASRDKEMRESGDPSFGEMGFGRERARSHDRYTLW